MNLIGISTFNLEEGIIKLLCEIDPGDGNMGNVSFGVNHAKWLEMKEAVEEYIRLRRNARREHWNNPDDTVLVSER